MAVLDLSKYKGVVQNRIVRLGVELEGGWLQLPNDTPQLTHDGSVKGFGVEYSRDVEQLNDGKLIRVGEIPSPPLLPAQVRRWILNHYPSHVNKTCGLHVHQSFPNALYYSRLMHIDYQDTMMEYLKRWAESEGFPKDHHIFARLRGEFEHCQLKFWPDKQVRVQQKDYHRDYDGHRYTAVNYCHGLRGKQTLEIRVLPMMENAEQAVRAVLEIKDITNACLVALGKRERPIEESFSLLDGAVPPPCVEETLEVI